MSHSMVSNRVQSLIRWRAGFAIAAVLLPLALFLLFERQARRLDALAMHGESVEAQVTAVSRDNNTVFYSYQVNGTEYTWNVARGDAPFPIGHVFPVVYLPADPSLSRPIAERSLAALESRRNRSFSWKVVLGVGLTLVLCAALVHLDLRRIRKGASSEFSDPRAYKRRLVFTSIILLSLVILIGGFHFHEAIKRRESIWPVAIGLLIPIGIIAVMFFFAGRGGPMKAQERSARILRWIAPIAVGIALLRLIAMIFGKW